MTVVSNMREIQVHVPFYLVVRKNKFKFSENLSK